MRVGIITVSDSVARGHRHDQSGDVIEQLVHEAKDQVVARKVVPDEERLIEDALRYMADELKLDLVLTTGGTGLSPRDVTPDVTRRVITKEVPGIAEAMRVLALPHAPQAMLSRAIAGIRNQTLIINLPGSPKGVQESLSSVYAQLQHAVKVLRGDVTHH